MNLLLSLLLALPFACLAILGLVAFLAVSSHRWRSSCDRHDHFGPGYHCSKKCRPVARLDTLQSFRTLELARPL